MVNATKEIYFPSNSFFEGLPNVGKSTLFNSLTKAGAESANYPFCTIDPNIGIVPVPDERLKVLGDLYTSERVVPATIEFVDIAGLVKGASKGNTVSADSTIKSSPSPNSTESSSPHASLLIQRLLSFLSDRGKTCAPV